MPIGQTDDIGAIRVRRRRSDSGRRTFYVRFIKLRNGGPFNKRWRRYARYVWEQLHGPVPPGKRVVHLDGNTLNDDPHNLALMTSGEWIAYCHRTDTQMSEANRRGAARRAATARANRERGQVERIYGFCRSQWYAVDHRKRVIFNTPFHSRRILYLAFGVEVPRNGVLPPDPPVAAIRGDALAEDPQFRGYAKLRNTATVKSAAEALAWGREVAV